MQAHTIGIQRNVIEFISRFIGILACSLSRRAHVLVGAATSTLREHLSLNQIYLLPLRMFIGIGWLRACVEKLLDPEWHDGTALTTFLNEHAGSQALAFPAYDALVTNIFLPHAALLSWVVIVGQFLAGIAILTGTFTNAALLGGLFMNVNFVLIGEPNPSAFYIVIQAALLITNAGIVFGLDSKLSRNYTNPLLCAQLPAHTCPWLSRRVIAVGALVSLGIAAYCLSHVTDFSPGGSIDDPAMILTIMAMLAASWFAIGYLRLLVLAPASGQMAPRTQTLPRRSVALRLNPA